MSAENKKPTEEAKAGTIGTNNGKTVTKEVAVAKVGQVKVEYLVAHGTSKKGAKGKMNVTTAEALVAHKIVEILK